MTPHDFIVAILATWYIAYILTAQSGPFLVLERIRNRVGGAFECIYCISPYVAAVVFAAIQHTSWGIDVAQIFAIAGAALMLRSYTGAGLHD